MRNKEVSEKTYTQDELRAILRFFIEDTRADKPWVDADDEWFEQFLQQNPINKYMIFPKNAKLIGTELYFGSAYQVYELDGKYYGYYCKSVRY